MKAFLYFSQLDLNIQYKFDKNNTIFNTLSRLSFNLMFKDFEINILNIEFHYNLIVNILLTNFFLNLLIIIIKKFKQKFLCEYKENHD